MSDFDDAKRYMSNLHNNIVEEIGKATAKNVRLAEDTVRGHLRSQDLSWKPLSPDYAEAKARTRAGKRSYFRGARRGRRAARRKGGKRLSEKTLIATSQYFNSITSEIISPYEAGVGVARRKRYKGGEKIANIALVHEYGSKDGKIPARPLWRPTADEIAGRCQDNWLRAVRRGIRRG